MLRTLRCLIAILCVIVPYAATAQTSVSGTINTTTWESSGSPYRVTGAITVPAGQTLTITEGVEVLFDADVSFTVSGAMHVHGTEADSVRFDVGTASEWEGLTLSGGDSSSMEYTVITNANEDGFAEAGGVTVNGDGHRLSFSHCAIVGNYGMMYGGLYAIASGEAYVSISMTDCRISGNESVYGIGGLCLYNGQMNMIGCDIRDNLRTGIKTLGTSDAVLENCRITGNSISGSGGGVVVALSAGHTVSLTGCEITGNTAANGGGILLGSNGRTVFDHCTIAGNIATNACSALWVTGDVDVLFSDCILQGTFDMSASGCTVDMNHSCTEGGVPTNAVDGGGNISDDPLFADASNGDYRLSGSSPCIGAGTEGSDMGAYTYVPSFTAASGDITTTTWVAANSPYRVTGQCTVLDGETLTIEAGVEVVFDADVQFNVEGAIDAQGTETDSVWFIPGDSDEWGGIRLSGGDASSFSYTRISGGNADIAAYPGNAGGAVYCKGPDTQLAMDHCVMSGNSASYGGAIHDDNQGAITLTDCTIEGCSATYGGAVYTRYSTASLTRCLLTGNTASSGGGAILNNRSSVTTIDRCTFSGNTAGSGGGAIQSRDNATATVTSSILWDDSPDEINIVSGSVAVTYSCIENGYAGENNTSDDPLFTDAAAGDYTLQESSPCIDAGDPSSLDPDGSYADMGAFPSQQLDVAIVGMGPSVEQTVVVTATTSLAASASLVFTVSSQFVDSVTIVSHAFEGLAGATADAHMVGDTVRVGLVASEQLTLSGEELVTLYFHVTPGATQDTTLALSWVRDQTALDNWTTSAADGTLEITLEYGDVTCDGNITATDATWVLQAFTQFRPSVNRYCADVSGDGAVTAYDAAIVMIKVLNPTIVFPVESGLPPSGEIGRPATTVSRSLSLDPAGDGWNLTVDTPEGVVSGGIVLAMPGDCQAEAVGATLSSVNRTGGTVRVGFVRDASSNPVLLHISGASTPSVVSATLNEIPVSATAAPVALDLGAAVPNPFNPTTTIRFDLPEAGQASLIVYNSLGQAICTLAVGQHAAGAYSVVWNGCDDTGRAVASGTYIYRLATDHGSLVQRMLLVR